MTVEVATDVVDAVRDRLARQPGTLTPHRVAEALRETGRPVGDATVLAVHEALRRDVVGAGPLEPLLRTDGVTDVLVNGPDEVYLDRGEGLEPTDVRFRDDDAVRRLAQRLAALGGRRLDDASPYVDSRLPDGTRFHAVSLDLSTVILRESEGSGRGDSHRLSGEDRVAVPGFLGSCPSISPSIRGSRRGWR